MPKSRKRHHSRSRSRSRSHSHDRREDKHRKNDSHDKDRDGKRRKIDSYDSPHYKRSVSCEPDIREEEEELSKIEDDSLVENEIISNEETVKDGPSKNTKEEKKTNKNEDKKHQPVTEKPENIVENNDLTETQTNCTKIQEGNDEDILELENKEADEEVDDQKSINISEIEEKLNTSENTDNSLKKETDKMDADTDLNILDTSGSTSNFKKEDQLKITPKKVMSPKTIQKKLESEKKRQQKQKERDEKEKEKERLKQEKQKQLEERERAKQEKLKQKQKLLEDKQKEKEMKEEQKRKEKEEKEAKRKEKEEREEQKRKEREQEKLKKQQEMEEKNKEKQKLEEKKQKAAAFLVNFFVPKKSDGTEEKKTNEDNDISLAFRNFELKSDMKLPPLRRSPLTDDEKEVLTNLIENQNESVSYLKEIKLNRIIRKTGKTWPYEEPSEDCAIIEEESDLGETICDDAKQQNLRAKYLKFHENRRPAYYGTWRKTSKFVKPRHPFGEDKEAFDYEVDSDDDWEEEEQGESLNGSDDEDKENDGGNEDYEVDNEFFVPHGHLSDDEIDDEETSKLSPESLKQKLKLLKDEFDLDMQSKTHKLKPRSIGCIWYNKSGNNVDPAINRYLQPLAVLSGGQIFIKKREVIIGSTKKKVQELRPDLLKIFVKIVHGNRNKKQALIEEFLTYTANNGVDVDINKANLLKQLKLFAGWKKCLEDGPLKNKFCWIVNGDVIDKCGVDVSLSKMEID